MVRTIGHIVFETFSKAYSEVQVGRPEQYVPLLSMFILSIQGAEL